ncbi:hypothetical protein Q604_UNBc4C00046G0046 [human gut metagenome]|jgi:hypothetical protein|uniref:Uncharacterized protein n=1 Tax=human gut metagenome TaxID=408170 RepID=W1WE58_9ZZZZ|nr:hypothetical protein [Clostridium butyricum]
MNKIFVFREKYYRNTYLYEKLANNILQKNIKKFARFNF